MPDTSDLDFTIGDEAATPGVSNVHGDNIVNYHASATTKQDIKADIAAKVISAFWQVDSDIGDGESGDLYDAARSYLIRYFQE